MIKKCLTKYCRGKVSKGKHCGKCYSERFRKKNPMLYCYYALKNNAKRRNKFFSLSFEEFKEFCIETKYMDKKGRTKNKYTIDRICNDLGYTRANTRCITQSENSIKRDLPF